MRKILLTIQILFLILAGFLIIWWQINPSPKQSILLSPPTPTPFNPFPYKLPPIKDKPAYVLLLVGDSMTEALGPSADLLRLKLINYYPKKEFVNLNFSVGGQNILTLEKRFVQTIEHQGGVFPPILEQKFDLILIESFAYNPLSQFPLSEGLSKQTEVLDQAVRQVIRTHPQSALVFLATIAPSRAMFAKGVYELSLVDRAQWVEERIAYLENHIRYAQAHQIPLINVYEKSLDQDGEADLRYINPDNYVHPSHEGIELISQSIAEFIFENRIFPTSQ